ncbi:hypothetical protein [Streptomyces sp. 6N223]|uniref:hypothetical protein n=1 Tax=Streptomyces sp. 6N223 TaxID=3457412 RepID=UPI003FD10E2F
MGTSKPWDGPRGHLWRAAGSSLSRWRPDQRHAERRLAEISELYVRALHGTVGEDVAAFNLREAANAAGGRLVDAMDTFEHTALVSPSAFLTHLATEVGGQGCTLTDAVLRRAAVTAGSRVLDLHPDLRDALGAGTRDPGVSLDARGLASDLLCILYRLFFADIVGEFLRAVVAEQISSSVPVVEAAGAEGRIADYAGEHVLRLLPDPCEEAIEDSPVGMRSVVPTARRLVPRSVDRALGLLADDPPEEASDTVEEAEAA